MVNYEDRNKSLITGKEKLKLLHEFKSFPVFIGCTEEDETSDLFADMQWMICEDSGMIQLGKLLPLDLIYSSYHSEAVGGIWKEHHLAFCQFLSKFYPKSILEIGGSNGFIAKNYVNSHSEAMWTIVEPNPGFLGDDRITVIKGFFDDTFKGPEVDVVVHSHVLEHFYDPNIPLRNISNFLEKGQKHIFSVPNLHHYLTQKFTNTLNFEHTYFLTEHFVDFYLKKYGFKVIEKSYFDSHSIFYATEKVDEFDDKLEVESQYEAYSKLFMEFISYYEKEVKKLNQKIQNFDGKVFLFGATSFPNF